jgi:SAM-dependent methyltransferase
MSWYEQWFDTDEYELIYRNRDEGEAKRAIDLIESVALPGAGGTVLDMGCGRGRHSLGLAARGYRVTGLDLSKRSLKAARKKAAEEGVDVRFIHGDMREPVAGRYDLVVNLFTAFGYFEAMGEHQRAVDAMAGALNHGAFLVQDFLNPAYVRANLVESDARLIGDLEVRQRRRIQDNRIMKTIEFIRDSESHSFQESVALLELADFERLYEAAGLKLLEVRGDYDGADFGEASPRCILFSQRS